MNKSVDLSELRKLTEGDKKLESELFREFFSSSEESIKTLSANCIDGESENWKIAAHSLKGTSYNLGAKHLGDLCKQAQSSYAASSAEKQTILSEIRREYTKVRDFLKAT